MWCVEMIGNVLPARVDWLGAHDETNLARLFQGHSDVKQGQGVSHFRLQMERDRIYGMFKSACLQWNMVVK